MLLAIDTATRIISLALHDRQNLLAETTWHTANNHTSELAPAIEQLLQRGDVAIDDLTALAVSVGPGSFTGLRIGVALAKAIASARGLPLVGVSTLDTLAAAQPSYPQHALIAVVEAGRGRIIAGTYRWSQGGWVKRAEPRLMDWATLITSIDGPACVTGAIDQTGFEALQDAQKDDVSVIVAPPAQRLRRAGFLADVAQERLAAAQEDFSPGRLTPQYVQTRDIP